MLINFQILLPSIENFHHFLKKMPTNEYTSTLGGALKLKGSKISKRSHHHHHNKKKRPKPPAKQPAEDEEQQQDEDGPLSKRRLVPVANIDDDKKKQNEDRLEEERVGEDEGRDDAVEQLEDGLSGGAMHTEGDKKGVWAVGKTEAERRHEEQRRKRVSFPPPLPLKP